MPSHNVTATRPAPQAQGLRVGIVEDDPIMGESLLQRLEIEGYDPIWWQTGTEALRYLNTHPVDLLVCDVRLPDMTGEEVFTRALPLIHHVPVLFITAFASIEQAVSLMRKGADEYITKPFDMGDFLSRLGNLAEHRVGASNLTHEHLGVSTAMKGIEDLLHRIADIESTVLFTGESGAGKEVAARYLHNLSPRSDRPFVAVNCAAIPTELVESEFFGHEKGAFTGAQSRHEGYAFRAADGTLFLDEIGDLPLAMQAKLLRLLQNSTFLRVGGEDPQIFRARVVCATNRNLGTLVKEGRFREDLYYRINVIPVAIPPLRAHGDDIPVLVNTYLIHYAERFGRDVRALTGPAEDAIMSYDWPGNIRELRNRVERAVALSQGLRLSARDLFPDAVNAAGESEMPTLQEVRNLAEQRHIQRALDHTGGQIKVASELLGISRTTMWEKMRKLGISEHYTDDERSET